MSVTLRVICQTASKNHNFVCMMGPGLVHLFFVGQLSVVLLGRIFLQVDMQES